jgi:tRNA-modifying protein YgfZ
MRASVPELPITDHHAICRLEDFGALRFRGPDARAFLQGQLSQDMTRLAHGTIVRAGLHNAQGRTLALLWLALRADDDVLALLPLELLSAVATHLRRYLLRAKLTLSDDSAHTRIHGLWSGVTARALPEPAMAGSWVLTGERALLIQQAGEPDPAGEPITREQWRALDIAAALPQVYAPTSAQFVAQMLNLDCIDAVSFTKGCYTGQEVIARAHYRGRVKRRMQRFESLTPQQLAPGDSGRFEDGRAFRVVEAVRRADGGCEFLAVAPLPGAARESENAVPAVAAADAQALPVRALALPYPLPL